MKIFAERLQELRTDMGLTRNKLSKLLHVDDMTITRWEQEERIPNIEQIYKIAVFFDVTVDYLIGIQN
ncbi:MAG: helix-turn-helix transcriptional regulator [Clostridiales bacterium]|nr:helix-turn-helix transcriptional regulator [Clostridiales bacterium]